MRQSRREIDLWQAEGGLLITFRETRHFAESQRSAFKEAPVDFLKIFWTKRPPAAFWQNEIRNYQKYYTISDLLENTKIRNRRIRCCNGGLILVYLVLARAGLYFF